MEPRLAEDTHPVGPRPPAGTAPDRERKERAALAALTMQLRAAEREADLAERAAAETDPVARRAQLEARLESWLGGRRRQLDREVDAAQTAAAERVLLARAAATRPAPPAPSFLPGPPAEAGVLVQRSAYDLIRTRASLPPRPGAPTRSAPLGRLVPPPPPPGTSPGPARGPAFPEPLPPRPRPSAGGGPTTEPLPPSSVPPRAPAPAPPRAVRPAPDPVGDPDAIDAWLRAVSPTKVAPSHPVTAATPTETVAPLPVAPDVATAEPTARPEPSSAASETVVTPAPVPEVAPAPPPSVEHADARQVLWGSPEPGTEAEAEPSEPAAEEPSMLATGLAAVVPPEGFGYQLVRLDGGPVPVWGGGAPMVVPPGGLSMVDPSAGPEPYDEEPFGFRGFLRRLAHPDVLLPLIAAFLVLVLLLAWLA